MRRANGYGCSYAVPAVTPNPRFSVTSAIAETRSTGSFTGHLCAVTDGRLVGAAVDVVGSEHVGDEDAVERAALQELGELGPVGEVFVPPRLVVGVAPHPGGLVGDAVHVEGVEADLAGHTLQDASLAASPHARRR